MDDQPLLLDLDALNVVRDKALIVNRAGFCGCVLVSAEAVSGLKAILGGLSLGRGIPFPDADRSWMKTSPNVVATTLAVVSGEPAGPFGRQVGEADYSHAMRKPSLDRRLDEVGREEGKRDRHVDLPTGKLDKKLIRLNLNPDDMGC